MIYRSDVFGEINARLNIRDVMSRYGVDTGRTGRNILCPFHSENTPSFKIYDGENRFYCFGCHAHGDIVGFVAKYLDLPIRQAIERVNADFGLSLNHLPDTPVNYAAARKNEREHLAADIVVEWYRLTFIRLTDVFGILREWRKYAPPDERAELWIKYYDEVDYLTDVMTAADMKTVIAVYRDRSKIYDIIWTIENRAAAG